jgi:hypothetical protein
VPTNMLFTGQRKVATDPLDGLYYYNARYYDLLNSNVENTYLFVLINL